mgnify:CR=1 FL=1
MKNLRLKEVLKEDFWIMPATPKFIDNGIPYITSKNIKNGRINFDNIKFISDNDYEKISKNRPILENDILISMIGTLGETAVVHKDDGSFYGQNMLLVRLDTNLITQRFFINFFKSNSIKNQLLSKQNKSTQSYLKLTHIEDLILPAYSIVEQTKISKRLDLIQEIISKKQKQLNSLDNLIKSLFVNMFNDKIQFPRELLKNNIEEMFIGPFGSDLKNEFFVDKTSSYCVVYEQKHAINKYIGDFRYINKDKYNKLKRFEIQPEDIIVSCRGTIGETYVIPKNSPLGIMHPSIMKIRLKKDKYNSIFFNEIISNYLYENAEKNNGGIIKMAIKASDLANTDFIRPDIKEQENYLKLKQQIDKQKFEIQNGLNKMKELYETLINKYFG